MSPYLPFIINNIAQWLPYKNRFIRTPLLPFSLPFRLFLSHPSSLTSLTFLPQFIAFYLPPVWNLVRFFFLPSAVYCFSLLHILLHFPPPFSSFSFSPCFALSFGHSFPCACITKTTQRIVYIIILIPSVCIEGSDQLVEYVQVSRGRAQWWTESVRNSGKIMCQ